MTTAASHWIFSSQLTALNVQYLTEPRYVTIISEYDFRHNVTISSNILLLRAQIFMLARCLGSHFYR